MIFLSSKQVSELRKLPTTRLTHVILEESHVTPLSLLITEVHTDGKKLEYEIDQEGKRNGA